MRRTRFVSILLTLLSPLSLLFAPTLSYGSREVSAQTTVRSRVYLPIVSRPYEFIPQTPNPYTTTIALESTRAAEASIPTTGGGLVATSANGTRYTLSVPADALLATTTIRLTPISSAPGLFTAGGLAGAVELQPAGLHFFKAVTLEVQPATVLPAAQQISFMSQTGGTDVFPYPLDPDPSRILFHLTHFTDVFVGSETALQAAPGTMIPSSWEEQYQKEMEELIRREREAWETTGAGLSDFSEMLNAIMRGYFEKVVLPILNRSMNDCSYAKDNFYRALGWARQATLLGGEGDEQKPGPLAAEIDAVMQALVASVDKCWTELTEPCLDRDSPSQMQEAIDLARRGQLLTGDPKYDPFSVPDCDCSRLNAIKQGWSGGGTMDWVESATHTDGTVRSSISTNQRAAVRFELVERYLGSPVQYTGHTWKNAQPSSVSGSVSVDDKLTTNYGWRTDTASRIDTGTAFLSFSPSTCVYSIELYVLAKGTATDSAGNVSNPTLGMRFRIKDIPVQWDEKTTNFTLGDSRTLPVVRFGAYGGSPFGFFAAATGPAGQLESWRGRENMGVAQVSWRFTPIDPVVAP